MTAPTTGFPPGYKGRARWGTPPELYATLDAEFRFTLDAAADPELAKAPRWFGPEEDGLAQTWEGSVFCNPPYSACGVWVEKGRLSAEAGATVVMLLPARTDTRWFHDHVLGHAEIRFIRGRVRYVGPAELTRANGAKRRREGAPFPSMVCVWRPR